MSEKTAGATTLLSWQYNYDALGNTVGLNDLVGNAGATMSFGSGDRDRVCRIGYGSGGLGGTACNVGHDGAGNIIDQATRTGHRTLSYFVSGKVRGIMEGTAQATFRYNPFSNVQELDVSGAGVSDTRHDRRYGQLIERRDQVVNGTTTTFISRKIPGPGGVLATRRGTGKNWVFQFREPRGNRFFIDGNGAFVQDVNYLPYGEAESSGVQPGSAQYSSTQWNEGDALAAFNLSHLGMRLYDPVIGRFLSRDPLIVPRTAATTNSYAFAMNDPINRSDPSGMDCIGQECQGPPDIGLPSAFATWAEENATRERRAESGIPYATYRPPPRATIPLNPPEEPGTSGEATSESEREGTSTLETAVEATRLTNDFLLRAGESGLEGGWLSSGFEPVVHGMQGFGKFGGGFAIGYGLAKFYEERSLAAGLELTWTVGTTLAKTNPFALLGWNILQYFAAYNRARIEEFERTERQTDLMLEQLDAMVDRVSRQNDILFFGAMSCSLEQVCRSLPAEPSPWAIGYLRSLQDPAKTQLGPVPWTWSYFGGQERGSEPQGEWLGWLYQMKF